MASPIIHTIPDWSNSVTTYLVVEPVTEEGVVINPSLDFDARTNRISTKSADSIFQLVEGEGYLISHILETGIHSQHISAGRYIQSQLARASGRPPRLCIGRNLDRIKDGSVHDNDSPGMFLGVDAFDKLFADEETFRVGHISGQVMHLSTKLSMSFASSSETLGYVIGENVFTSLPGGISSLNEESRQWLLNRDDRIKVYGLPLDPSQPSMDPVTIGDLKEYLGAIALQVEEASHSPIVVPRSAIQFYAPKINARGGRIPRKINLGSSDETENIKQKQATPRPLLIPRKLEMLLC